MAVAAEFVVRRSVLVLAAPGGVARGSQAEASAGVAVDLWVDRSLGVAGAGTWVGPQLGAGMLTHDTATDMLMLPRIGTDGVGDGQLLPLPASPSHPRDTTAPVCVGTAGTGSTSATTHTGTVRTSTALAAKGLGSNALSRPFPCARRAQVRPERHTHNGALPEGAASIQQ